MPSTHTIYIYKEKNKDIFTHGISNKPATIENLPFFAINCSVVRGEREERECKRRRLNNWGRFQPIDKQQILSDWHGKSPARYIHIYKIKTHAPFFFFLLCIVIDHCLKLYVHINYIQLVYRHKTCVLVGVFDVEVLVDVATIVC